MNERIQELLHQCSVPDDQAENYSKSKGLVIPDQKLDVAKFAELIVRECVKIGDNYEDILGNEPECFNCRKVAYGIVDKIQKHFGVEE